MSVRKTTGNYASKLANINLISKKKNNTTTEISDITKKLVSTGNNKYTR